MINAPTLSIPPPSSCSSSYQSHALRCALKAAEGLLFPMEKAFMFVSKPTMYLAYNDVDRVVFDRAGSSK